MSDFYNQGAVPIGSQAYIPRKFEEQVFREISAGNWVLLLGPRQHGKSTGLVRLAAQFRDSHIATALVDLQGLPPCATFQELLGRFADQIGKSIDRPIARPREEDRGNVVSWLEGAFPAGGSSVVVIIDEAASIENTEFRNAFYGQIRQISSERAHAPAGALVKRISFVFAGTFRPETLVQDQNSPFNVCQPIHTDDVTRDQATELATRVHPAFAAYVGRAHATLNGQPYLLQTVFQETSRRTEMTVDQAFEETLNDMAQLAGGHLEGIFSKVVGSPRLTQKVAMMVRDGAADLVPADSDCLYLQVIGLAKRQGNKLVFRNTLYADVARISPQIITTPNLQPARSAVFGIPKTDLGVMKNANLCAICFSAYDGAVKAHGNGSYRLSLTGFGSAMEALLLDLLLQQSAPNLQTAIVAAEAESEVAKQPRFSRTDSKTDPMNWTLFNMINVARKIKVGAKAPDPSHVLRDWRNLVHPALAMLSFIDESKLEPESRMAAAMFSLLLRDISP